MVSGLATLRELDDRDLVGASARLGELLLEQTRPLVERYEVVKDVRGLGLMWAIEFGEPDKGRTTWRMLEKMQPGIFAQLVVVPLFTDHRILSQVAGHRVNIVKGLPPLVVSEDDIAWFAAALDQVVGEAQKMGARDDELRAARGAGRPRRKPRLQLADLGVPLGDAAARPALGDRDQPAGELADQEVVDR